MMGAQPAAGELQLEVFGTIGRQQGHAIAFGDVEACERAAKLVYALVEPGVGEGARGLKVVDRQLLRPTMGVVCDPVVVRRNARHLS
jgi:hypothetical protein